MSKSCGSPERHAAWHGQSGGPSYGSPDGVRKMANGFSPSSCRSSMTRRICPPSAVRSRQQPGQCNCPDETPQSRHGSVSLDRKRSIGTPSIRTIVYACASVVHRRCQASIAPVLLIIVPSLRSASDVFPFGAIPASPNAPIAQRHGVRRAAPQPVVDDCLIDIVSVGIAFPLVAIV